MALLNFPPHHRRRADRARFPASACLAALASVCLISLAILGCSSRERANPLDPGNPTTGGRPSGFVAVALSGQVLLSWNASPRLATQIFRRAGSAAGFSALTAVLPPGASLYTDLSAPNDIDYHYLLYFVTAAGPTGLPDTALATPSRVIAWTADARRGSLLRLGADGRAIAAEEPLFGEPGHLAVDRERDIVWVTDLAGGRVVAYRASIGARVSIPGFQSPNVIAVDPGDGSAWVSDFSAGTVRHVLSSGGPGTPSAIAPLDGPLGVDVDPQTRSLWVCERRAGKVRRFDRDGVLTGTVSVPAPSRVAVDSANGEAWITSFESGLLVHVATDLTVLHTVTGLQGPVGVAVDARRGRIWVADPPAGRVLAYRRDGSEELRVNGLAGARDLTVEPASGEAWVAASGTVARISPAGVVVATSRGLTAPVAVGLDRYGP